MAGAWHERMKKIGTAKGVRRPFIFAAVGAFLVALAYAATYTETFSTSANYTVSNSAAIGVSGGLAQLIKYHPFVLHNSKSQFDSGTYGSDTEFMTTNAGQNQSAVSRYDSGLVAYYALNGNTGAIANNATSGLTDGKGSNNGTASNANGTGMAFATGKFGNGVSFDGVDDYISLPSGLESTVSAANDYTISFWFKANSVATRQTLFTSQLTGLDRVTIQIDSSSQVFAGYYNGTSHELEVPITASNWYHLAFTKKGSTIALYINGQAATLTAQSILYGQAAPQIGGESNRLFNGTMDDVAIYNRALSATEVATQYSAAARIHMKSNATITPHAPKLTSNYPGIVAYWPLDDTSGTTQTNDMVGVNKGTLHNVVAGDHVAGVNGNALSFSGGRFVTITNNPSISLTSAMTISIWANGSTESAGLIGKNDGTNVSWELVKIVGGLRFVVSTNSSDFATFGASGGVSWPSSGWHHAAVVYNGAGSGNSGRLQIYIDGVAQSLSFSGTIPATLTTTTVPVVIGAQNSTGSGAWTGQLDEVAIFNRALAAGEVAYLAGLKGQTATYTSPVMDGEIASPTWDKLTTKVVDGFAVPYYTQKGFNNCCNSITTPTGIALADMDGDGALDIVYGNSASGASSKLGWVRNGKVVSSDLFGAQSTPITISTTVSAQSVALGDLNGDGNNDIVVADYGNGGVKWFLNGGGASPPTFTEQTASQISTDASPYVVAIADIDGDGNPDIVAGYTNPTNKITWYKSSGGSSPTFTAQPDIVTSFDCQDLIVADINGDGFLDIAAASKSGNTIAWFKGNGGSSWTRTNVSTSFTSPYSIGVADFDGNGTLDILSATGGLIPNASTIAWWSNDGSTTPAFASKNNVTTTYNGAGRVYAVDLDGDGYPDILSYTNSCGGTMDVWKNNGSGTFTLVNTIITCNINNNTAFGDLDGDGHVDIASLNTSNAVFFSSPWKKITWTNISGTGDAIAAADLNGDGWLDIVLNGNGGISRTLNNGNGTMANEALVDNTVTTYSAPITADLSGDGVPDIIASDDSGGGLFWWQNNGAGSFGARQTIDASFKCPAYNFVAPAIAATDVDGDGLIDVIAASTSGNEVSWWKNNGDGTWTKTIIQSSFTAAGTVAVRDIDGDGKIDVIGGGNGILSVWKGNGTGFGAKTDISTSVNVIQGIALIDLNKDGFLDLVYASNNSGNVSVRYRLNDGAGNFGAEQTIVTTAGGLGIKYYDLDNDGNVDIIITSLNQWIRNLGNLAFSPLMNLPGQMNLGRCLLADLDGDGRADLAVIAQAQLQQSYSTVKLQLRTDSGSSPSSTFVGPDNSAGSYFGSPAGIVSALDGLRYGQWQATFYRNDTTLDPMIASVRTDYTSTTYVTTNPYIQPVSTQSFSYLTSFTETATKPAGSAIQYILSPDAGSHWYYYNSGWVASDGSTYAQSSPASTINTNIAGFDDQAFTDGRYSGAQSSSFTYRALFNSNGSAQPSLDQVDIGYETGSVTVASPNGAEIWKIGSNHPVTWTTTGTNVPNDLTLEYSKDNFVTSTNITTSASASNHNEEKISGAVGVWHLDGTIGAIADASTTSLTDSKGTGNGTASNANGTGMAFVAGKFGNGVTFDGVDDYITVPNSAALNPASVTVSAWIKTSSAAQQQIVYKTSNAVNITGPYNLWLNGGKPSFSIWQQGSGPAGTSGLSSINDGAWHHLAGTFDVNGNKLALYVDGTLVSSTTSSIAMRTDGTLSLVIGARDDHTTLFNGSMDDVAVFNRALSAAEIAGLAANNPAAEWTIPNDNTTAAKVRVRSVAAPAIRDSSDNTLSIADLNITSPNTAVVWKVGASHNITWTALGSAATSLADLTLEYSSDTGLTWNAVAGGTNQSASGGTFAWTVPNAVSITSRVRVRSVSATDLVDASDVNFTIADLNVVQPNGGEYWMTGTTKDINWASAAAPNDLTLQYSTDGSTWTNIATGLNAQAGNSASPTAGVDPASISGAVAVYRFNDGTGTTAKDGVGTNDATLAGSVTWTTGQFYKSVNIPGNGLTNYISAPDSASLSITGNMTVSAWVNISSGNATILDKTTTVTKGYLFEISSFIPRFYTADNVTSTSVTGTVAIPSGVWTHVAAVYDGSFIYIYVNGVLTGQGADTRNPTDGATTLYIGRRTGADVSFTGFMDDLAIYNRALSPAEIRELSGGTYSWTVPAGAQGSGVKVRVKSVSAPELQDDSDNVFTVANFAITSPNGTEVWKVGAVHNITWTATDGIPNDTQLVYSTNGGTTFPNTIATSLNANGSSTDPGSISGALDVWRFDTGSGTTAVDAINSGNNGTLSSGATWSTVGKSGYSMKFDGTTNGKITVPTVDYGTVHTIAFWVKPIVLAPNGADNYFMGSGAGASGIMMNGPTSVIKYSPGNVGPGAFNLVAGTWTHIAITRNGTTVTFYKNGVQVGVPQTLGANTNFQVSAFGWNAASGGYYTGYLDDVVVYNRVLSGAELTTLASTSPNSYAWTIPNAVSNQLRVKIASPSAPLINDMSDANFSIADLNVGSPNGGEVWNVTGGSSPAQIITWNATSYVPNDLTLEYSTNGASWTSIATNQPAAGNDTGIEKDPTTISGAVAVWKMNESSGTSTADTAGSNSGTLVGGVSFAAAKYGNGISFNGTTGYVTTPDLKSTLTGAVTVAGWIKTGTAGPSNNPWDEPVLMSDYVDSSHYLILGAIDNSGKFFIESNNASSVRVTSVAAINDNAWHHVAVTRDQATGKMQVFVDGALSASATGVTGSSFVTTASSPIGKNQFGFFNGLMDDLAVYNRVLSQGEIVQLAGRGYAWTVPAGAVSNTTTVRVRSISDPDLTDVSDANATVYNLKITAPNTAVSWAAGSSQNITWTQSGLPGATVKLLMSTDSGGTYPTTIATGLAKASSPYAWTVPNNFQATTRVKVVDESNASVFDASDVDFTVNGEAISVTKPAAAEVVGFNTVKKVNWTVAGGAPPANANVQLDYSTDGLANSDPSKVWNLIDNNIGATSGTGCDGGATGCYDWAVPQAAVSNTVVIRVKDAPGWNTLGAQDAVDGYSGVFRVTGTLALIHPNGGEKWAYGAPHTIAYQVGGSITNVKISYSTDNFATSTVITASTSASGSYTWTPAIGNAAASMKIRVEDVNDSAIKDESDASFSVTGVTVTAPNAASRVQAGTAYNITWTQTGISNVKIEYTLNASSGATYSTIIASTPAAGGTYAWTTPSNTAWDWQVRVSDADAVPGANGTDTALATDTSDNSSTIYGRILVTAPNGAENWSASNPHDITWTVTPAGSNVVPNVKIFYTTSGFGSEDIEIDPGVSKPSNNNPGIGTGKYTWTPTFTSTTVKIRVVDANDPAVSAGASAPNTGQDQDDSDAFFTLSGISITAPTAGASWTVGTKQQITAGYTGGLNNAKVEYSSNGGTTYAVLPAGSIETSPNGAAWTAFGSDGSNVPVPGQPFYIRWTVPDAISTSTVVRITQCNVDGSIPASPAQASTPAFTITGALSITTPGTLTVGGSATLSWTKTGTIGSVTVDFSPSGNFGGDTQTIGTGLSGTSTSWTVPDNIGTTGKVRVTDTASGHPATSATSSAFAIKGNFTFVTPVGSTAFGVASSPTVTWSNSGTMSTVKLEYATDAGGDNFSTWTQIAAGVANNGSYTWSNVPDLVVLAGNQPNPPSPIASPTSGLRNVKLRITDTAHSGSAQAQLVSSQFTVKYYLVTFNVTNSDGNNLANLVVSDSVNWNDQTATLTSPTQTKRYYQYAPTQTATFSKNNFTASTATFTPDSDKTVNLVLESETPTPFQVNLFQNYNTSTSLLSLSMSLSKAGSTVNTLASLGTATITIYATDGVTVLGSPLTNNAPDANGLFKFTDFDPSTLGMTSGNSYPVKCDVVYNGVTKTSMNTINFTAAVAQQTIINAIGSATDVAGTNTVFGKIAETTAAAAAAQTASQAAQSASQATEAAIGSSTDAAGANTLFGKDASVLQSLGAETDGSAVDGNSQSLQARIATVEKRIDKPAGVVQKTIDASPGDTANLRFKTDSGLSPTIDVYDPNNNKILAGQAMKEIGSTGVYQLQWAISKTATQGDYTAVVTESHNGNLDSMTVHVVDAATTKVDLSPVLGSSQDASTFAQRASSGVDSLKSGLDDMMKKLNDVQALKKVEGGGSGAEGASPILVGTGTSVAQEQIQQVQQSLDSSKSKVQSLAAQQGLDVSKLMEYSEEQKAKMADQTGEIKVMKDHIVRMNAILEALQKASGTSEAVVKQWMETGSLIIKVLAINPSKDKAQEIPIRTYLPLETKPENIINRDELSIGFDSNKSLFYAEKKVMLKPGETYTMQVHIEDIWNIPENQLKEIEVRSEKALKAMEGSSSYDLAKILHDNVAADLKVVRTRQNDDSLLPDARIAAYRMDVKVLDSCSQDLNSLEILAAKAGSGGAGKSGQKGEAAFMNTAFTWKIMLGIVFFLALLSGASFMVWERQIKGMTLAKDINMVPLESRAMVQKALTSHALKDRLTGLFNVAHFRTLLKNEADDANVMRNKDISLIMLDVDYFKKINDTFGHIAGDKVLKGVADVLKSNLRKQDAAFRYGGEEFMVILSGVNSTDAMNLAEKIRRALEEKVFFLGDTKAKVKVTASFGVTSYPYNEDIENFINRADKALYRAKALGRNQVCREEPAPVKV